MKDEDDPYLTGRSSRDPWERLWSNVFWSGVERSCLLDDSYGYITPPDERPLARVLPFRKRAT